MQLKKQLKNKVLLLSLSFLFAASANAATDMSAQENFLRAKVMNHQNHENHVAPIDKSKDFHGVFYGFFPCDDCNGIKMTLSLKQNNHYLLVTQPARESSREFFEKGKYEWDDETQTVTLKPRTDVPEKQFQIKDEGTLVQFNSNGKPYVGDLADRYTLRRSDTVKSREVHIH